MFYKTVLLGGATLAALSTPVLAQTVSEDEIITTALRAISPQDVTSSLSILEFDDLAIRNSPYLADQLRAVPGVGISRTGSVGGLTQIRIRGAEANHTLVLVNGVEVSNPVTGETDFSLWSGLNTSRIEVARGEQSALYGHLNLALARRAFKRTASTQRVLTAKEMVRTVILLRLMPLSTLRLSGM